MLFVQFTKKAMKVTKSIFLQPFHTSNSSCVSAQVSLLGFLGFKDEFPVFANHIITDGCVYWSCMCNWRNICLMSTFSNSILNDLVLLFLSSSFFFKRSSRLCLLSVLWLYPQRGTSQQRITTEREKKNLSFHLQLQLLLNVNHCTTTVDKQFICNFPDAAENFWGFKT